MIYEYLAEEHRRFEKLLNQAAKVPDTINLQTFTEFRAGLLRHIAMEEKILLPAAKDAASGNPLPLAAKLRLDHGALASLLVMTPTPTIIAIICSILDAHNPLEEGPGGVYEQCERLANPETAAQIEAKLRAAPAVLMAAYVDNETALNSAKNALKRAGYNFEF